MEIGCTVSGISLLSSLLPLGMASLARAKEAEKVVPPYCGKV